MKFTFNTVDTDEDALEEAMGEFDINDFTITVGHDRMTLSVDPADFDETLEMLNFCQFQYRIEE